MQELVQSKRDNPKDTVIEQELKLWKAEASISTHATRTLLRSDKPESSPEEGVSDRLHTRNDARGRC